MGSSQTHSGSSPGDGSESDAQRNSSSWFGRQSEGVKNTIISTGGALIGSIVTVVLTALLQGGNSQAASATPSPPVTVTTTVTAPSAPNNGPTTSPTQTAASPAKAVSLKDLRPAGGAYGEWSMKPVAIGGKQYKDAMSATGDSPYRDYMLGKRFRHFTAIIGIADDSADPGSLRFTVEVNGAVAHDETVPVGEVHPIDLNIEGAVRIKIASAIQ